MRRSTCLLPRRQGIANEIYESSIPLHPSPDAPLCRPWRPVMLRRAFLLFFAVSCAALIALLQVLDTEVRRHQGIDASRNAVVNCLRYLPTVAVVFLGFIWRSLISDLKLMMPWSAMTD